MGRGTNCTPLTAIHLHDTQCNWRAPFLDHELWRIDMCWFCSVWGYCLGIAVEQNKGNSKLKSRHALPDYRLMEPRSPSAIVVRSKRTGTHDKRQRYTSCLSPLPHTLLSPPSIPQHPYTSAYLYSRIPYTLLLSTVVPQLIGEIT